tara:strand:- start:23112 stop:24014 length:903 start_codon:yes stop_codon:yes gene_type:complete
MSEVLFPTVTMYNADLARTLTIMKRKQTVNGKQQAQVESLLLVCMHTGLDKQNDIAGEAIVTSLTRDLSGLTYMSMPCKIKGSDAYSIPIPSIDNMLGIIKLHGEQLTLTFDQEKNRLKIKSTGKQTTLDASKDAKAFSHSPDTIAEFHKKGMEMVNRIWHSDGVYYRTGTGDKIKPLAKYTVDSTRMYEALRCDNMNGQRLNRYTLGVEYDSQYLTVQVGDMHLGQTLTEVPIEIKAKETWEWQFDGGLDEVFKSMVGTCDIYIYDFREQGQGMRLYIHWPNIMGATEMFAFQAGVLTY